MAERGRLGVVGAQPFLSGVEMVGFALSTYLFYLLVGGFALEID